MYITQFGNYPLPTEQWDMSESQGASRRHEAVDLPGVGGAFDLYGAGQSPRQADTISKSFMIEAATPAALDTLFEAIKGNLMQSQTHRRQGVRLLIALREDGSQRATWARCTSVRWSREWWQIGRSVTQGPIDITWQRSHPVWFDYDGGMLYLGDHLGTLADTSAAGTTLGEGALEITPIGGSSPLTLPTITNSGNAETAAILFEFVDPMDTPSIENTTNGYTFTYNGAITSGDRVTVNAATYEVTLNGVRQAQSVLTVGTRNGQLLPMVLEPGDNVLILRRVSSAGAMRIYHTDQWN